MPKATAGPIIVKSAIKKPALKTLRKIEFKSDLLASNSPVKDEGVKPQKIAETAEKEKTAVSKIPAVKKASKKSIKKNMPAKAKIKKTSIKKTAVKKTAAKKAASKKPKKPAALNAGKGVVSAVESKTVTGSGSAIKSTIILPGAVKDALSAPKRNFVAKPFKPIYEAEIESDMPAATEKKKFGLYRPSFKPKESMIKEESLEKLFQSSPKIQKAQKAAMAQIGSESKPLKPQKKLSLIRVALWLIFAFALLIAYDIFGLYQLSFKDSFSTQVASVLNLPAGSINGQMISMPDFIASRNKLSSAIINQREGVMDYSGKDNIQEKVFYYLAVEKLVQNKLNEYRQIVDDKMVDNQIALLLQQTGGQAGAEKVVQNLYDMPLADFKAIVLKPMLERQALLSAIMSDPSVQINTAAEKKAIEVLSQALASSTNFEALAKQYSDDESSVNTGGDLGWVSKGQLDSSWEPLIFSAATGTVIKQVVKSAYGYHIIKVEQKVTDAKTGAVNVKLRHILIAVNIDQYIKDLLAASSIDQYAK